MHTRHQGGRVCGAVRYVTEGAPERVSLCHCAWCQKRTGTAFGTEAVFRAEAGRFSRGAPKVRRAGRDRAARTAFPQIERRRAGITSAAPPRGCAAR
ncbi:MAG TPA: GFA family protein [Alphaproteobacteria bacterium]|nr:GFA family protein [Alphaproteobacteria bacterium]